MGILNVTTDSFSDGGRWVDVDAAVARATKMVQQGASIIDIGGESTRPGAARVPPEVEQARVIPVVRQLSERGIRVSVDTMRSTTAKAAAAAGAEYINDVSGGLADARMFGVVADTGVKYIAMHWREHSDTMQNNPHYDDVVADVLRELDARVSAAAASGIELGKISIDPGLGFSKTAEHNWRLVAAMAQLNELGLPVLVGASRKSFLGEFAVAGAPPKKRDAATATISGLAAQAGMWAVRVHHVPSTRQVFDVLDRVSGGTEQS
jgi:dihydropteroate synthase